ncbi:MAG TPA: hypothetical protein VLW85_25940 [Myxococcales bacterium]|nr:hypothetical protein [Myxococcales bacterium]
MKLRLLLVLAVVACEPSVNGRCTQNSDCDTAAGVFCDDKTNICIAASGTCNPACSAGQLCSAGVCSDLKPVVTVAIDSSAVISPASPDVTVNVQASASIALQGLSVEVDAAGTKVASGSIDVARSGDNTVTLTDFQSGAVGAVSVTATLQFGDGESVRSVAVPASIDAAAPSVMLALSTDGWVLRTGPPITITATADDGSGSGAQSATLSFDNCGSCHDIAGQLSGNAFTFQVSPTVQAKGSEDAIPFTVTVLDRAGNAGTAQGSLQIDDAAPAIGAFSTMVNGVLVAGVTGEDGTRPWFPGGSGAEPVEIVVPVSDAGSGFATMTLLINSNDVPSDTPLSPEGNAPGDGTVHFLLPAPAFDHEGQLRFTLTAKDALQNTSTRSGVIYVDAVPPTVTSPAVDYADATPAGVCDTESSSFNCGRRAGTALLRDDSATVSFTVIDCGSGVPSSLSRIGAAVGTTVKTVTFIGRTAGTCANGSPNMVHQYSFTINAGQDVGSVSADDSGSASVALVGSAPDRTGNGGEGNSAALISLWRWKRKLGNNITASPALLPGASAGAARSVAAGTDATSGDNGFVIAPDGSQAQHVTLFGQATAGDVVVSASGNLYVTNGADRLGIFAGGNDKCGSAAATFGAPPVLATVGGKDTAYLLSTAAGSGNFVTYTWDGSNCIPGFATLTVPGGGGFTGASFANGLLYGSHAQGFSSYDLTQSNKQVNYSGSGTPPAAAPPSISGNDAFFASDDASALLHRTKQGACFLVLGTCWNDDGTAFGAANAALPYTPVFDADNLWNADGAGVVYQWPLAGGSPQPKQLTGAPSAPVLLQDGSAIVVQKDGPVVIIPAAMSTPAKLINLGASSSTPLAPVVDARGSFGVAYVAAPSGWLYALQTPVPPAAATATTWPRPGRDSCNSRNADSSCP